ncbi:hypothetical protein DFH07DRAFT_820854 [Mycena maculata]|uniref:Uncharacterized protein n=1 Tax=Mycena maculata TaxID=230809 RepID=A0AAD7J5H9_9AGAR|nr:hypothetical protein DFH07DRAFT_820854 [Mycena maculata]
MKYVNRPSCFAWMFGWLIFGSSEQSWMLVSFLLSNSVLSVLLHARSPTSIQPVHAFTPPSSYNSRDPRKCGPAHISPLTTPWHDSGGWVFFSAFHSSRAGLP